MNGISSIKTGGIQRAGTCGTGSSGSRSGKPPWIKIRLAGGQEYRRIKKLKEIKSLNTVCEAARCPNLAECWSQGHATFMVLGDICTRNCRFCSVTSGTPGQIDPEEPARVAEAALRMGLSHTVVTSVTRDDLGDGGAGIFAAVINELRGRIPASSVEVLVPDFGGNWASLERVLEAGPDILGHNIETVTRLYKLVRPQARYSRSLALLNTAKKAAAGY